jgi:gliding motility-associated-like protein
MKQSDNIEQLFKQTFENFEADVNPKVWSNVQHGIHSAPAGGIASTAAKFTIGKIIAGVASVAAIAGSAWYFTSSDNKTISPASDRKNQTEISNQVSSDNIIAENKSAETVSNSGSSQNKTASASYSASSNQNVSNQTSSEKFSYAKAEESSSVSQAEHNDAHTSQEPATIVQKNQTQNSQPKPQENNSSSNNLPAEQLPSATIFANTESGDAPLTINFSNQGTASTLNWDFGDGSTSTENSPSHTFNKPGTYIVNLSAKNSVGNASDKVTIEVKSVSGITYIPNVFTPNGDGNNDYFFLKLKNIASIEMVIKDMTDMHIVYKSTDPEGKWDGKNLSGADAPPGRYWWMVTADGIDGIHYEKFGMVVLTR